MHGWGENVKKNYGFIWNFSQIVIIAGIQLDALASLLSLASSSQTVKTQSRKRKRQEEQGFGQWARKKLAVFAARLSKISPTPTVKTQSGRRTTQDSKAPGQPFAATADGMAAEEQACYKDHTHPDC